jgi:arylsulfatase A-like enzyme
MLPAFRTVVALTALLFGPGLAAESAPARPNVILIMSDDHGWGDVGFNGNRRIETPHLDRMATEGMVMERFYASPICSPTRGSVLTGRHPLRYGIHAAHTGGMRVGERTIAETLQRNGYATGIFGKWHLGWVFADETHQRGFYSPPWHHGFEECFVTTSAVPTWNPAVGPAGWGNWGEREGEPWKGGKPYTHNGVATDENLEGDDSRVIMDRVIPFVRASAGGGKPFLAVVWFHTPHEPVVAGPEYLARYADLPEQQAHYYGAITAMDEQIGRLREELRALGIAENTLVSFTSDNGPDSRMVRRRYASAGPFRGSKHTPHEGGLRVPTIFAWPGTIAPGRTSFMGSTYDYFPTILEALEIPIPADRPLDGISLVGAYREGLTERSQPVVIGYQRHHRNHLRHALIEHRYKLIFSDLADGPTLQDLWPEPPVHLQRRFGGAGLGFELFDLLADPGETKNLAAAMREETVRLIQDLDEFLHSVERSEVGADYEY